MGEKVQCPVHGEREPAFVCTHLTGEMVSLGFNRNEPTPEDPYPDAWCNDCELIRAAAGGWNEDSEAMATITVLCSGCYERARIRNTVPSVTLEDLSGLRWKCFSCEAWHTGPCLDIAYSSPHYWNGEPERNLPPAEVYRDWLRGSVGTFLTDDYCAINNEDFFVRGLIHLPLLGAAETFRWGVWGSLSRQNFTALLTREEGRGQTTLPPMFSWLSTKLAGYPDTLSLKMYAHMNRPNERPSFELEPTDHPLSQEYHHGISPGRVRDFMKAMLRETE